MKKLTLATLFLIISTTSLFAQANKVTAAIRKVMDDQVEAWNRGDIDRFMTGYWRSERLVFISGDTVTRGWQPTLDRYKKTYSEAGN
jgi:beta-aspartyl-peptidase (threonine type)